MWHIRHLVGISLGCTDQASSTVIRVNIFHMKRMGLEEMGLKLWNCNLQELRWQFWEIFQQVTSRQITSTMEKTRMNPTGQKWPKGTSRPELIGRQMPSPYPILLWQRQILEKVATWERNATVPKVWIKWTFLRLPFPTLSIHDFCIENSNMRYFGLQVESWCVCPAKSVFMTGVFKISTGNLDVVNLSDRMSENIGNSIMCNITGCWERILRFAPKTNYLILLWYHFEFHIWIVVSSDKLAY